MEQVTWVLYTIAILFLGSSALLLIKSIKKHEVSLMTSSISRLLSTIAIILFIKEKDIFFYLLLTVLFISTSDFINNILWFITKKYREQIDSRVILLAMEQLKGRFAAFFENSLVGLYVINESGNFEFINKKLVEISGYSREELLKMNIYQLVCEEDLVTVKKNIDDRINGKVETIEYEISFMTKNREKKRIRVLGTATTNGHKTISGTILPL